MKIMKHMEMEIWSLLPVFFTKRLQATLCSINFGEIINIWILGISQCLNIVCLKMTYLYIYIYICIMII